MAATKGYIATGAQCRELVDKARRREFAPVYLLMGEEPYYSDMVCDAIVENALEDYERDFNETICYGADVDADAVITAARRFPMMAERSLVVVKEAQAMKTLDDLSIYCQNPLDSTVLVILLRGASADKRKSLYKTVQKIGVVLESNPVKDYELQGWISEYYASRGLKIDPDGAALLAEAAGTDLSKIALETDKLLKNLPEGTTSITAADIEKNVGISRSYSVFELTKELSYKNSEKALKVAAMVASAAKFAMPMAVSALFTHFNKILRYEALLQKDPRAAQSEVIRVTGIPPYFIREYDTAARNYPLKKTMAIVALLSEYDFKGKGGFAGEATPAELLIELVTKILNV